MNPDTILDLAHRARGPLYARLLKARIEIAKRGGPRAVPQSWLDRLAVLDREYWTAQAELVREWKRWKKSSEK